jgi:acyl-coenzyme A thioesterase PaaI-like protein
MVPFNRPHGFRIIELGDYHLRTKLPYRRNNLNHLNGLHACALGTLTEITGGLLLVTQLNPNQYRIILKKLEVTYLYQGKTDAYGEFSVTPEWISKNVLEPLKSADAVEVISEVKIYDEHRNQLTEGRAFWQVKDWTKVKTKT